jgi:hypothetical protein
MTREKGKNTKFARKSADAMVQQRTQIIDTSKVIEIK